MERDLLNAEIARREQYEWCRMWIEQAQDASARRVLLIGDSISEGYRPFAAALFAGRLYVDGYTTSRAAHDAAFFRELQLVLCDYEYDVIGFNNGLHGPDRDDNGYARGIERALDLIAMAQRHARVLLIDSTPYTAAGSAELDVEKTRYVTRRNAILRMLAQERALPLLSLYDRCAGLLSTTDGVHYAEPDRKAMAGWVCEGIEALL